MSSVKLKRGTNNWSRGRMICIITKCLLN